MSIEVAGRPVAIKIWHFVSTGVIRAWPRLLRNSRVVLHPDFSSLIRVRAQYSNDRVVFPSFRTGKRTHPTCLLHTSNSKVKHPFFFDDGSTAGDISFSLMVSKS